MKQNYRGTFAVAFGGGGGAGRPGTLCAGHRYDLCDCMKLKNNTN